MSGSDFKIALLQERITVTPGVCLHALCTHSTEPGHQYCPQCERERRNKKLDPTHLGLQQRESAILFPFRWEQTSVWHLSDSPMPAPLQHFQHVQQKQLDQGGGFSFGDSSHRHGAVNTLGSAGSTPQGSQQFGSGTQHHIQPPEDIVFSSSDQQSDHIASKQVIVCS